MKKIAIIPARGGSKRIPRKNIKDFNGKPIIAYSIEAALASGLFDEVMVSTDDEEIASVALGYGAKVPFFRSVENAGDFATTADVLIEVLRKYQEGGRAFDFVCCIYPTAPFVKAQTLTDVFDVLINENKQTAFPLVPYPVPIQIALKINSDGNAEMIQPKFKTVRTQDMETTYYDPGQFYWIRTKEFLLTRDIFTSNSGALPISEMQVHDIDTPEDWEIAEFKYRFTKK